MTRADRSARRAAAGLGGIELAPRDLFAQAALPRVVELLRDGIGGRAAARHTGRAPRQAAVQHLDLRVRIGAGTGDGRAGGVDAGLGGERPGWSTAPARGAGTGRRCRRGARGGGAAAAAAEGALAAAVPACAGGKANASDAVKTSVVVVFMDRQTGRTAVRQPPSPRGDGKPAPALADWRTGGRADGPASGGQALRPCGGISRMGIAGTRGTRRCRARGAGEAPQAERLREA